MYFSIQVSNNFADKKMVFLVSRTEEIVPECHELDRISEISTGRCHLANAGSLILKKSDTMKTIARTTKQVCKIKRLIGPTFTH